MGVVIPGDQLGRNRNTRRRLDLVTGQHLNLDARIPRKFQCALDFILPLVFNARQTQELKILLEALGDNGSHSLVPPVKLHAWRDVAP